MQAKVEAVFRTEGVPQFTFIRPPNYGELLVDIRTPGKPVIIEGQSGTGKTTTVKTILNEIFPESSYRYYTPRDIGHIPKIIELAEGSIAGTFIIDDFHRLDAEIQEKIANTIKVAADSADSSKFPKLVIIGINKVGSGLINLVHDLGKRIGIHRIHPAIQESIFELLKKGEEELNIKINNKDLIYKESKGDYWLTQLLAQSVCLMNNVTERRMEFGEVTFSITDLRLRVISKLEHSYDAPIKEFCRGRRFRPTNDPYFKLLMAVGRQESSVVDLTELANANPDFRGSINNIKDSRLSALIAEKDICSRYFYYNEETKYLAIEDPALFYYLRNADWNRIKKECGFRMHGVDREFDVAISFAGEQRHIANEIKDQLLDLDCSVFYDDLFEANYLGKTWRVEFKKVFADKCRLVVCLLDRFHSEKIWPTFERECFIPRVKDGEVIPIYLDDTIFVGIPGDIVGIKFDPSKITDDNFKNMIFDEIAWKLYERLSKDGDDV